MKHFVKIECTMIDNIDTELNIVKDKELVEHRIYDVMADPFVLYDTTTGMTRGSNLMNMSLLNDHFIEFGREYAVLNMKTL